MLRVMMLSTDLQRGGLPMRLARLAIQLRGMGVEPIVGCLTSPGPLSRDLADAGVETFSCDATGRLDVRCLAALSRPVRRIPPDVLHAALFHANLAARWGGRLDRPRPVVTGTVTIEIERRWHRLVESLTAPLSDVHVANSQAVADHLVCELGFAPERLRVIPNGVDLERMDQTPPVERQAVGIPPDAWLVVWAGRMDPVKNLPVLVEAVTRAASQAPVRAVLLGDGPERSRIAADVHRRGLDGVIRVAGWSNDVVGWLKAADCLCFPSFTEGSPNAVIEAMGCHCCVIASDIAAHRELIRHGESGWLVPARDARAFCDRILQLREDRVGAQAASRAARRHVERYHRLQDVATAWVRLYEDLIRGLSERRASKSSREQLLTTS